MKAGRIVMIVIGALIALVGFGMVVGGAGALVGYGTHRDADGFFRTPSFRLASPTYAIVSDHIDLEHPPRTVGLAHRARRPRYGQAGPATRPTPPSPSSPASARALTSPATSRA